MKKRQVEQYWINTIIVWKKDRQRKKKNKNSQQKAIPRTQSKSQETGNDECNRVEIPNHLFVFLNLNQIDLEKASNWQIESGKVTGK